MPEFAPLRPLPHLTAVLLACALWCAPAHGSTKKPKADGIAAVKVKKSGKAPKFIKGSEETVSERDRRLLRECKGRVNAGACAGYTG